MVGVFFFFQAEDGIRDYKVTGVQTCGSSDLALKLVTDLNVPPRGLTATDYITYLNEKRPGRFWLRQ